MECYCLVPDVPPRLDVGRTKGKQAQLGLEGGGVQEWQGF